MRVLRNPTTEEVYELVQLRHTKLLAYFRDALNSVKDTLVATPDEAQIRVLQGQAQVLQHIVHLIEEDPGKR